MAKGTQEELLLWIHSDDKDLCWEAQFDFRNAVAGHMTVARETPTFIYRNSLDLTGFIDGTGNPAPEDQHDRAIVPDGQPGAGGAFCIAQRWVHDLNYFNGLSLDDQENVVRPQEGRLRAAVEAGPDLAPRATSSCATATPPTRRSPSAARWCAARRRTRSTTARRPVLHGLLPRAGADARADGSDLRQ